MNSWKRTLNSFIMNGVETYKATVNFLVKYDFSNTFVDIEIALSKKTLNLSLFANCK